MTPWFWTHDLADNDVIELSSDEDSSDSDDVTVTKDEDEEVEPEDPNNGGSHINDAINVPDDMGRVLVNIGHTSEEEDLFLAPQITRYIRPHQVCTFLSMFHS